MDVVPLNTYYVIELMFEVSKKAKILDDAQFNSERMSKNMSFANNECKNI